MLNVGQKSQSLVALAPANLKIETFSLTPSISNFQGLFENTFHSKSFWLKAKRFILGFMGAFLSLSMLTIRLNNRLARFLCAWKNFEKQTCR